MDASVRQGKTTHFLSMDYLSQLKDSPANTKFFGLNRKDSKESLDSMKDSTLSNDDVSLKFSFFL